MGSVMDLELWFPQPIWFKNYDSDFSTAVSYIQKLKTTSPGNKISNIGGWQSSAVNLETSEELKEVFNVINAGLSHVEKTLKEQGFGPLKLETVWINVNKGKDYNREHVHPGSTFSGCLYLKVSDKSGVIEFKRPDNMTLYPGTHNKTGMFYPTVTYKPVSGMLLIFPAWLSHLVFPSDDDEERISVAFNVTSVEQ
jgi:uncharacterized protein (TIGR02466 family)